MNKNADEFFFVWNENKIFQVIYFVINLMFYNLLNTLEKNIRFTIYYSLFSDYTINLFIRFYYIELQFTTMYFIDYGIDI